MRLLIAEDEEQLSRAVAAVLTHTGYQVDTAANGAEAVELHHQLPVPEPKHAVQGLAGILHIVFHPQALVAHPRSA